MTRFLLAIAFTLSIAPAIAREIAITFDDAPTNDTAYMKGDERTKRLIAALKAAGIEQTVFFAIPRSRAQAELARLAAYVAAGHLIANHSNTHRNLKALTADEYLADIAAADVALKGMQNFRPWFRFPFLSEGDTREKRDSVRAGLRAMSYAQGYVTVDNYDWYMNTLANNARKAGANIDEAALRDLYVETLMKAIEFYDAIAVKALNRSPRHVLLLHENDLAALYIGDLAAELRKRGWTIATPEAAYADPIAHVEPDTLFLNQGRVAAIAHTKGMKPIDLIHEREDEAVLEKLFSERVLKVVP
jgi:peptidoglycan/xylan/chitin deacetylase (PgdA/CDA1 family)